MVVTNAAGLINILALCSSIHRCLVRATGPVDQSNPKPIRLIDGGVDSCSPCQREITAHGIHRSVESASGAATHVISLQHVQSGSRTYHETLLPIVLELVLDVVKDLQLHTPASPPFP